LPLNIRIFLESLNQQGLLDPVYHKIFYGKEGLASDALDCSRVKRSLQKLVKTREEFAVQNFIRNSYLVLDLEGNIVYKEGISQRSFLGENVFTVLTSDSVEKLKQAL
jgi:hypothetical protein